MTGKKYAKKGVVFSLFCMIGFIVQGPVAASGIVAGFSAGNGITMRGVTDRGQASEMPRLAFEFGLSPNFNQSPVQNVDVEQDIVSKKMGKQILHIPRGFIAPTDGYRRDYDLVQLWALLPCFEPLDRDNAAEFHKNTLDRMIKIRISSGEKLNDGQAALDFLLKNSVIKMDQPPDDSYQIFDRGFGTADLFVFRKPSFNLYFDCNVPDQYLRWPQCHTSRRIWEDTRVEYHFERKFIAKNVNDGLMIDEEVSELLNGFLSLNNEKKIKMRNEKCK